MMTKRIMAVGIVLVAVCLFASLTPGLWAQPLQEQENVTPPGGTVTPQRRTALAAATGVAVYDNTTNFLGFSLPTGNHELGDGATLAGTARTVTNISLMIHTSQDGFTADVTVRLFEGGDDVGGTDPGALLWQSATFTGFAFLSGSNLYDFAVPNVLVPDSVTWTVQLANWSNINIGTRFMDLPTLGSSQDFVWLRDTDTGAWTLATFDVGGDNNFGARIDAVPASCPADFDASGDVGVNDLLFLLGAWGDCPKKGACPADFDNTGDVGVNDLLVLLGNWGPCP